MSDFRRLPFMVGIVVAILPIESAAADEVYRTDYGISIYGLTIAKSGMETRVRNGSYELNGTFSSSGIARVFDKTDGTIRVKGTSSKGTASPNSYDLLYQHGKKSKTTAIRFARGGVVETKNSPPVKKSDPWVETTANDLKGVADPLSALMITAKTPQAVCGRNLRVFDGQTRADIQLTYSGMESVVFKGHSGQGVVCSAKFIPISGYQKGKKAIDFLANKSQISITFASLGNSGIYAPVIARIGTQIGTVKVSATYFEKVE